MLLNNLRETTWNCVNLHNTGTLYRVTCETPWNTVKPYDSCQTLYIMGVLFCWFLYWFTTTWNPLRCSLNTCDVFWYPAWITPSHGHCLEAKGANWESLWIWKTNTRTSTDTIFIYIYINTSHIILYVIYIYMFNCWSLNNQHILQAMAALIPSRGVAPK